MKRSRRALRTVEWIGGVVPMPAYVTGEGEPYRPDVVLWLSGDGLILASDALERGAPLSRAVDSFQQTTRKPMAGPPHQPDRVRVASSALADLLRDALPSTIEVTCAPTPEIDAVMQSMLEHIAAERDIDDDETHFSPGVTAEALASFYRTAARLFRAKPWTVIPTDSTLVGITIESLGVVDVAVSVVGHLGEHHGFIVLRTAGEFDAFVEAALALEREEEPRFPPHVALNFERGAEIAPSLRKEIAEHGWEIAGASAYPWIAVVDPDAVSRPPTAAELLEVELIAGAVAALAETAPLELDRALDADPIVRTVAVDTAGGPRVVKVKFPLAWDETANAHPDVDDPFSVADFDVNASIVSDGGDLDHEALEDYAEGLLERFADSPEAEPLDHPGTWTNIAIDYAAQYFGETPATMKPHQLEELVFELIPRKVSCPAAAAGEIVLELRALYAFLGREYGLKGANALAKVLAGDAEAVLRRALSDPRSFGIAKSMVMAGKEAGFDTSTRDGLEAWMRQAQGRPLPSPFGVPSLGAPPMRSAASKASAKAKKNKRKAERKARKKNR